jgi:site-specific recombinase XerD
LVQGALATGCRYGELTRLLVSDFNREAGTMSVHLSKGGKVRHAALAEEGMALCASLTAGRAAKQLGDRDVTADVLAKDERATQDAVSSVVQVEVDERLALRKATRR